MLVELWLFMTHIIFRVHKILLIFQNFGKVCYNIEFHCKQKIINPLISTWRNGRSRKGKPFTQRKVIADGIQIVARKLYLRNSRCELWKRKDLVRELHFRYSRGPLWKREGLVGKLYFRHTGCPLRRSRRRRSGGRKLSAQFINVSQHHFIFFVEHSNLYC